MLHPGFAQIYRAAKEAGMYVTVFSNGTLLDDEILELFDELPPLAVEISLYGACSATHDGVTGVEGSFDLTVKAIEQLLEHGVKLRVKSMLMKPTEAEFDEIRQLVEEHYGLEFRMDAALIARLDGDCSPLDLRVEPAVAVEHEMRCRGALERWRKLLKKRDDSGYHACVLGKRLYRCGAGAIGFHVDAGMRILPCLMTSWLGCELQAGDFAGGWQKIVELVKGQEAPAGLKCVACDDDILCGWCPAYVEQELGDTGASSSFLCELAGYRREAVCSSCD
jgi:MoaA/NifB/PqqE/SkfB family radical SAM enzyme